VAILLPIRSFIFAVSAHYYVSAFPPLFFPSRRVGTVCGRAGDAVIYGTAQCSMNSSTADGGRTDPRPCWPCPLADVLEACNSLSVCEDKGKILHWQTVYVFCGL